MKPQAFDYWSWWRHAVTEIKIQPEQAWKLDFVEIHKLINSSSQVDDLSVMLNYERAQNGASKKWLQNH